MSPATSKVGFLEIDIFWGEIELFEQLDIQLNPQKYNISNPF